MPTIRKTVGQITLKVLTDVESTTYYYLLVSSMAPAPSAPTTNPPGGGWSTTEPGFFSYVPTQDTAIITGKNYYIRSGQAGSYIYTLVLEPSIQNLNSYYEKIYGDTQSLYVTVQTLYSDGTYEYTTPSLSSSYEAAKEAYNRAQTALTLTGNINQYFWNLTSPYSTSIPAGVYITEIAQSQFKSTPSGGNVVIQSGGITLRDGINPLASFSGSALNFYNPSTHEANATLSTNGMILSKGGIKAGTEGQNDFVYLSTEDYPLKEYRPATGSVIDSEKIYYKLEPQKYAKVEEPTVSDLNNYYEFIEYELTSDVTIDENKDYYIFENNEYIIVDEPIVDNISTYYELINKYQPTSDSVIDTNKDYYEVTQYSYVIVDNPIISEIANYYELVEPGITINNHTPAKSDINIQKITDDIPWREVIGSKFGVDAEGNLYASGANISGAINATSLTIAGGNGNFYNGAAAINISGYSIEIIDTTPDDGNYDTTYLVPYLYHNGAKVTNNIDYSHFIWYKDEDTIGIVGDENDGGIIAFYGHIYRVTYDFDDGAVEGGTVVQERLVDPSKYITQISDTGITIHPEVQLNTGWIQLDGTGLEIFDNTSNSLAKYGSNVRIGQNSIAHIIIGSGGLDVYNNTQLISHLGFDSTINSGTIPYFTFGQRANESNIGSYSVAEGYNTIASGNYSHSGGQNAQSIGNYSFAYGLGVKATTDGQTVLGKWNTEDSNAMLIIGNGLDTNNRSNLMTISDSNVCIGKGVDTEYSNQFICGRYNEDYENILFSVGNGFNDANRHNILSVHDIIGSETDYVVDTIEIEVPIQTSYIPLSHHPMTIMEILMNGIDKTDNFSISTANDTILYPDDSIDLTIGDVIEVTYTVVERYQMVNVNDTYIGTLPGQTGDFITTLEEYDFNSSWTFTIPNTIYPSSTFYILTSIDTGGTPIASRELTQGIADSIQFHGYTITYNGAYTLSYTYIEEGLSPVTSYRFRGIQYSTEPTIPSESGIWIPFNSFEDSELYSIIQRFGWLETVTRDITLT